MFYGGVHNPSEFRRKYMKDLVLALRKAACLDTKRAKEVASILVSLFEEKLYWGHEVDLGFITLVPVKKKSIMVKSHLDHSRGTYQIGERVKWKIRFSPAWLRKRKPLWSK